jgi:hypothetical protein
MSPPHIARYLIVIIAGRVTHEYATPIQRFAIRPETGRVCTVVPSARVAKLADAPDLGSGVHGRGGSSPPSRTTGTRSPSSMTRIRRSARLAHQVRSPTGFVCEPLLNHPYAGFSGLGILLLRRVAQPLTAARATVFPLRHAGPTRHGRYRNHGSRSASTASKPLPDRDRRAYGIAGHRSTHRGKIDCQGRIP